MTSKVYKSAQGKTVDMGRLQLQNENVRAVGNMKANARGDIIDNHGHVVATRGQQVNRNLNRQTNANAGPIPTSNRNPTPEPKLTEAEQLEQDRQQRQAKREAMERGEKVELKGDAPTQGLAAAMARAEKLKDTE